MVNDVLMEGGSLFLGVQEEKLVLRCVNGDRLAVHSQSSDIVTKTPKYTAVSHLEIRQSTIRLRRGASCKECTCLGGRPSILIHWQERAELVLARFSFKDSRP